MISPAFVRKSLRLQLIKRMQCLGSAEPAALAGNKHRVVTPLTATTSSSLQVLEGPGTSQSTHRLFSQSLNHWERSFRLIKVKSSSAALEHNHTVFKRETHHVGQKRQASYQPQRFQLLEISVVHFGFRNGTATDAYPLLSGCRLCRQPERRGASCASRIYWQQISPRICVCRIP